MIQRLHSTGHIFCTRLLLLQAKTAYNGYNVRSDPTNTSITHRILWAMETLNGSDLYRPPITTEQHRETTHNMDVLSGSMSKLNAGHSSPVIGTYPQTNCKTTPPGSFSALELTPVINMSQYRSSSLAFKHGPKLLLRISVQGSV